MLQVDFRERKHQVGLDPGAATMLKTTAGTVSEIAYTVGFSSPSYFSRCYKEYFGESPVETQSRTSKAR